MERARLWIYSERFEVRITSGVNNWWKQIKIIREVLRLKLNKEPYRGSSTGLGFKLQHVSPATQMWCEKGPRGIYSQTFELQCPHLENHLQMEQTVVDYKEGLSASACGDDNVYLQALPVQLTSMESSSNHHTSRKTLRHLKAEAVQ